MPISLPSSETAELAPEEKMKGVLDLTLESERKDSLLTFSPEVVDRRTQMAMYSMDKLSKDDYNNYSHQIRSGKEELARQKDAREDGLRSRELTNAAIQEFAERKQGPATSEERQIIQLMMQAEVHPDAAMSVWERRYAERVLNDALNIETYVEGMETDPDTVNGAQDVGNEVIQKHMMFKNIWEKFEAKHQEEDGWTSTILKNVRSVLPFVDHYAISNASKDADVDLSTTTMYGKTTTELMDDLWATPLTDGQFERKVTAILDGLYESSSFAAQDFGNMFMDGYGHGSETFRNVISVLDLTTLPSIAKLSLKGLRALGRRGARNHKNLMGIADEVKETAVRANGPQYEGSTVNGIRFHAVQSPKRAGSTGGGTLERTGIESSISRAKEEVRVRSKKHSRNKYINLKNDVDDLEAELNHWTNLPVEKKRKVGKRHRSVAVILEQEHKVNLAYLKANEEAEKGVVGAAEKGETLGKRLQLLEDEKNATREHILSAPAGTKDLLAGRAAPAELQNVGEQAAEIARLEKALAAAKKKLAPVEAEDNAIFALNAEVRRLEEKLAKVGDDAVAGTIDQIAQVTEAVARGAPPDEIAQAGGSFIQAAILRANQMMGRTQASSAQRLEGVVKETLTLFRPMDILRGAAPGIKNALAAHIVSIYNPAVGIITDPSQFRIATEGAINMGHTITEQILRHDIIESNTKITGTSIGKHAQITDARWGERLRTEQGIPNVKRVRSEEHAGSNSYIEMFMVDEAGMPFASRNKAFHYSEKYNYQHSDIQKIGKDQHVLVFRKDVNMKDPRVLESLFVDIEGKLDPEMALNRSFWGTYFNKIAGPHEQVHPLARHTREYATHKGTQEAGIMSQFVEHLSNLSKRQQQKMWDFTQDLQGAAETYRPDRLGDYALNQGDLQNRWLAYHGETITDEESFAYWSFVMMNDVDYVRRNLMMYTALARQGVENIEVSVYLPKIQADGQEGVVELGKTIEGRTLDALPLHSADKQTFNVLEINENQLGGRVWSKESLEAGLGANAKGEAHEGLSGIERINKRVLDGEVKIVQVANPSKKPFDALQGAEDIEINYVITKIGRRSPLGFKIFPYTRGGHRKDVSTHRLKQAAYSTMRRLGSDLKAAVTGDTTFLGFDNLAKSKKYLAEYNKGIALIRKEKQWDAGRANRANAGKVAPNPKDLDDWVRQSFIPDTPTVFRARFEQATVRGKKVAAQLSWEDDLHIIKDGDVIIDAPTWRKEMGDRGIEIDDRRNSIHNLYNDVGKAFVGQREDRMVQTIAEEYDEAGRLSTKEIAMRRHNPIKLAARTTAKMIRTATLERQQVQSAENFVEQVARMTQNKAKAAEYRRDPLKTLNEFDPHTMQGVDYADKLRMANFQAATKTLMGTKTKMGEALDNLMTNLYSKVYESKGDAGTKFLSRLELERTRDPVRFLRGMAFHSKLGLLNPMQVVVQGQSFFSALAISGDPRIAGTSYGHTYLMRTLSVNSSDEILNGVAERAAKTFGGTKEEFIEAWRIQQRNGWDTISGEAAVLDNSGDPSLWTGKGVKFLNKAAFFFFETERALRVSAFNMAYREFRKVNPKAVITNLEEAQILSRAKTLSINMTREANARWQQGAFSTGTQFWAYQGRTMDLMFGRTLTWKEKARLVGVHSVLYGVPTGVAGTSFGIWPWGEDLRSYMLANDYKVDEGVLGALMNGIIQQSLQAVGYDNNFADRLGPGGIDAIRDLWSGASGEGDSLIDMLGGASASILFDIIKDTLPIITVTKSWFSQDQESLPLRPMDIITLGNNISSFSSAHKIYAAINIGRYINTNGDDMGEFNGWQAVARAITGLEPTKFGDIYRMRQGMTDERKLQAPFRAQAIREMVNYYNQLAGGKTSDEEMNATRSRAKQMLVAGRIPPDQFQAIDQESIKRVGKDVYTEVVKQYYLRGPMGSPREEAQEALEQGRAQLPPLQ